MPKLHVRKEVAASCGAALLFPVALYAIYHRMWKVKGAHEGAEFAALPVNQWTTAHVAQWLQSLGLSEEAIEVFKRNEMDGPVLLLCEESHLQTLSLKLRDRLLVQNGLKGLHAEKVLHPNQAELPRPVRSRGVSPSGAPNASAVSAHPNTADEGAMVETSDGEDELSSDERAVKAFLDEANAIYMTLSGEKYREASPAEQEEVRKACKERFKELVFLLREVPEDARATLMPLLMKVDALINMGREVPSALPEQVANLHKMVDTFLPLLVAAGSDMTANPQFIALRERGARQIREVLAIAMKLPSPYGEPLQQKCMFALERIAAVPHTADSASADAQNGSDAIPSRAPPSAPASTHAGNPEMSQMTTVVQRLREIFSSLRTADVAGMPAEPRLARIGALLREVRGMESGAASWADKRGAEVILRFSSSVADVLQQMEALTREELSLARGGRPGESKPTAESGAAEAEETAAPQADAAALEEIVVSLKVAMQVLQSAEFAEAPAETQAGYIFPMQRKLRAARSRVARMPVDETTAAVSASIERMLSAIETLTGGYSETDEDNEEENNEDTTEYVPAPANSRAVDGEAAKTADPSVSSNAPPHRPVEAAVTELEKMFEELQSEKFTALPPAERAAVAGKMLQNLADIEQRIERYGGDAEDLRELVKPLKDILRLETNAAPTALFRALASGLMQVADLVTRDEFRTGSADQRLAVTRAVTPEVQRAMGAVTRLPPQERAEIERMIESIYRALQQVVSDESRAAPEEAPSNAKQDNRMLNVFTQLEAILSFVQSDKFEKASVSMRCTFALELVRRLDVMVAECLTLGDSGTSMLSLVQRLRTRLASLARDMEAANEENSDNSDCTGEAEEDEAEEKEREEREEREEENEEEPKGEETVPETERAAIFDALAEVISRLRTAEQISLSEVYELRSLLALVDSLGCTEPKDQQLRAELAEIVERFLGDEQTRELLEIEVTLTNAVAEIARSPPCTPAQLRPYMDILSRAHAKLDGMSGSASRAFSTLQARVLDAMQAMQNGETSGNLVNEDIEPNPDRDDMNNDEDDECGDERDEIRDTRAAEMLLDISDRLREGPIPNDVLVQFEDIINRIEALCGGPDMAEAVLAIREQIRLQRISNGLGDTEEEEEEGEECEEDAYESEDANDNADVEGNGECGDGAAGVVPPGEVNARGANVPPPKLTATLRSLPDEGVPGAESCALLQLPRIERRLAHGAPPLTLFDVQCMSAVLLSLNTAPRVCAQPELRERVDRAKVALARHLDDIAGDDSAAPPRGVECVAAGAGRIVLRAAGELCHGEQSDGAPYSRCAEAPPADTCAAWLGRSTALLLCADDTLGSTARGELARLHDLLVERYAFDVVTVPASSAANARRLVECAAADGAVRLLVLCRAPAGDGDLDETVFADGSRLSHADIVAAAGAVERVVVAHCEPSRLAVLPARCGAAGPLLTATATPAACDALLPARCWLYDGLFAPALAEFFARSDAPPMSPADIIAGPAEAIAGGAAGAITDDPAATMAFFVPFDKENNVEK